jgi:hypothetical protein
LIALAEDVLSPVTMIERGVATLYHWLGEGASYLKQTQAKQGVAVSFEYPLPADYMGIERIVRILFPSDFPKSTLRIEIDPSPWLEWPHAMPNGVCLFGLRQQPVSGTPEEVVDESLRRLGQLVELVMPDGDAVRRKVEFDDEIMSYWRQQFHATLDQLMLLQRPSSATALFALADTRLSKGAVRSNTWLAQDLSTLKHHWKRMTGETRPVRAPVAAAFYLPLTSIPSIRVPIASDIFEWLAGHAAPTDFPELRKWTDETAILPLRWLILRLPGDVASHHFALVLRGAGMRKDGHINYGRRAARRAANKSTGQSKLRELAYAQVHVLDRYQVHSRDVAHGANTLADARVVIVGVGSLGSVVASHLARSGVGHLWLVDCELLEDANLGRHALGMDDLGKFKAEALSERLQRDIPTINVASITEYAQVAYIKQQKVFDQADLIISTTADWASESELWAVKANGSPWMFMQSWSEPHAQIGHVLLAPPGQFDGRVMFDASGRFNYRMSEWPDDGIQALPGCGSSFIPGGPAAMASVAAMVAETALAALVKRPKKPLWITSIGSPDDIAAAGGGYKGPTFPVGATRLSLSREWPVPVAKDS